MKIKDAFNKLSQITPKQAFDWAFRNNGNKVDHTRMRLIDGTPLHSTGLWRLLGRMDTKIASFIIPATYFINQSTSNPIPMPLVITGVVTGMAWNTVINWGWTFPFKGQCINTKPDEQASSDPENQYQSVARRASYSLFSVFNFVNIYKNTTIETQDKTRESAIIMTVLRLGNDLQKAYHFHKIAKGDWVLESPPPPEKKTKREKSWSFSLPEFLQPRLTPVQQHMKQHQNPQPQQPLLTNDL